MTPQSLIPLQDELARARTKFPDNRYMLTALAEEVGELAEAWLIDPGSSATRKEALQVACVAMRIVQEPAKPHGECLEVVRAMQALEPQARKFWDSLEDRPDLAARSHPEPLPEEKRLRISAAPGATPEECQQLVDLITEGLKDPDFVIVTNFPLSVEVIPAGAAPKLTVEDVAARFDALGIDPEIRERFIASLGHA